MRLVGVRVLGCDGSGTTAGVVAGIDWVTADHQAGAPAVANMSLGGGASTAIDTAVRNSIVDGVSYAVAAGNGNSAGVAQDACASSPARVPAALTVGATDRTDTAASFSNYGSCVDLFAPGDRIVSAVHTGDSAAATYSGTSMAAPHVAGAVALYLQGAPTASPSQVNSALLNHSILGVLTSLLGSANRLLHTVLATEAPPTDAPAPAVPAGSTRLTLSADAAKVRSGSTVTLRGALTGATSGAGLGGRTVTLRAGSTAVGKVVTAGDGSYAARVRPGRTTTFTATFAGDGTYLASSSSATTVKVSLSVRALASRTKGRPGKYAVVGVADGGGAGTKLLLQLRKAKSWKTVSSGRTGTAGAVKFKVKLTKRQTYSLRISTAGATSKPLKIRVR